jgi:uncharacterized protein (TIGR03437 family)
MHMPINIINSHFRGVEWLGCKLAGGCAAKKEDSKEGRTMFQSIRDNFMKWAGAAVLCMLFASNSALAQGNITTWAGNGNATFSGDNGPATGASLNYQKGVAFDGAGNAYIADVQNYRVRRVNAQGMITTVAGNGVMAESGDGGYAVYASISNVMAVAVDPTGNIYLADVSNRCIRKISAGIITTIAGVVGRQGFSGDNGPAASAMLGQPVALALDTAGNLYFADSANERVRKIDLNTGIITTVAGNGINAFSGDGGLATSASLGTPIGVAADNNGNIYIADADNNRIRKVTAFGIISTVAGNGTGGFAGDGGQATSASLNIPSDVLVDAAGNLYIADAGNNRVRKVDPTSLNITTIAGGSTNGYSGDGGPATQAILNHPWGLAEDASGNLYISDGANNRVRLIGGTLTAAPSLANNSALNGATFALNQPIAPGAIVSIFGSNFSTGSASFSSVPMPTMLDGTSVTFNGVAAPLFYVSSGQINAQAPFNMALGPVQIQVSRGGILSPVTTSISALYSPGIFVTNQQISQGAIVHNADFSLVTTSNPARVGEYISIFATGLGPVNGSAVSGAAAPSVPPFAPTVNSPIVMIGTSFAYVNYSGLAPGYVGLYQVNALIPSGIPAGNQPLIVSIGGTVSNTVLLPVAQ